MSSPKHSVSIVNDVVENRVGDDASDNNRPIEEAAQFEPTASTAEDEVDAINNNPDATVTHDDLGRDPSNDDHGMITVDAYLPNVRIKPYVVPDEHVTNYVERRGRLSMPEVIALAVCVILSLGAIIGLSVGFAVQRSKEPQPTESPVFPSQSPSLSLAPSDTPTVFDTSSVFSLVAEQVKTEFGIGSYKAIQDDKQSPQSKAARWIGEEDIWFTFPIDDKDQRRHFRQRYALATFFYSTGGEESWIDNANFLSDLHECEWSGDEKYVTILDSTVGPYYQGTVCVDSFVGDVSTMCVAHLTAVGNNLTGSIPEEIWGIDDLMVLELMINHISGPIPDGLYSLPELQLISLPFNQLSGTISTLIGTLSNLQFWYTHDANFTGTLPSEIGNLTQLSNFGMVNCSVGGTLPDEYSLLDNIRIIYVDHNLLSGTLPSWVSNRPSMIQLSVDNNLFTGTIPNGSYPAIQILQLTDNFLTGTIPTSLFHGNLEMINVGNNNLTGSLPKDFSAATNLILLAINDNALTGNLPTSLGQLSKLGVLNAYYNQLTGPLVDLGNSTSFYALRVAGNELTGIIPESYLSLPLQSFEVSETQLVGNLTKMCTSGFRTQIVANCPPDVIW